LAPPKRLPRPAKRQGGNAKKKPIRTNMEKELQQTLRE